MFVESNKVFKLLQAFREIDSEMPMQMAATFVAVAKEEGLTMARLSEVLAISQSSTSRNVAALSKVHRNRKPGHDLVFAQEDPMERRRKIVFLTEKGKKLAQSLHQIMS